MLKENLNPEDKQKLYRLFWFEERSTTHIQTRIELIVTNGLGYHNTINRIIKLMQKTRRGQEYKKE